MRKTPILFKFHRETSEWTVPSILALIHLKTFHLKHENWSFRYSLKNQLNWRYAGSTTTGSWKTATFADSSLKGVVKLQNVGEIEKRIFHNTNILKCH